VIVGCAMPEAEQGMNVARIGLLLAGMPNTVPGVTINRFCASGVQTVAMAADRIRLGEADVMIAAGTETMSLMNQMMGNKIAMNPAIFEKEENYAIGFRHGHHRRESGRAVEGFARRPGCLCRRLAPEGLCSDRRRPLQGRDFALRGQGAGAESAHRRSDRQGVSGRERRGTALRQQLEGLARLRPVFAARGSVTAGNSSQMSDGAAAVLLVSEKILKQFNLKPLARFAGYSVAGVRARDHGHRPDRGDSAVLKQAGISQDEVDWFELNEAFAAQALAVMRTLDLDPAKVNPLGGAIALGHPLGATGHPHGDPGAWDCSGPDSATAW
jgi:acetyl-CoA acyltransferase